MLTPPAKHQNQKKNKQNHPLSRIIASLGKEARHPYLDERVCQFVHDLPLSALCDLTLPKGVGDKRILREVAVQLGLRGASALPKRAIQFGSRVSKAFPNQGTQRMPQ
jgi:asparagine synthetase B (glutamine-hydrolysing)